MIVLSREQHCALANIDITTFKDLRKRGLLPTIDAAATSNGERGYTPLSTLMLIMAIDLFSLDGLSREAASSVALSGYDTPRYWKEIAQTSLAIANGEKVQNPIICGVYRRARKAIDLKRGSSPSQNVAGGVRFCLPFSEITERATVSRMIYVNVSEVAAQMRIRADIAGIDLSEFWCEG